MEMIILKKKDIGLERIIDDVLPYAVVDGGFEGSLQAALMNDAQFIVLSSHIVPHGQQLKILYLNLFTENALGRFQVIQTNPSAAGLTGAVEAFPVRGSVPPYIANANSVRDIALVSAAQNFGQFPRGPQTLEDPVLVLEGSIQIRMYGAVAVAGANHFGCSWWGVEKDLE